MANKKPKRGEPVVPKLKLNPGEFKQWQKMTGDGPIIATIWQETKKRNPVCLVSSKEDKNSIPQCIRQSHITTAFSNMAPFPSHTRVRQTCADVQLKQSNFMTSIHGKRKQVMPICTGDRTFAGQTYYDGPS